MTLQSSQQSLIILSLTGQPGISIALFVLRARLVCSDLAGFLVVSHPESHWYSRRLSSLTLTDHLIAFFLMSSAAIENDLDHDFAYSLSDKASLFAVSSETFLIDCLFLSPSLKLFFRAWKRQWPSFLRVTILIHLAGVATSTCLDRPNMSLHLRNEPDEDSSTSHTYSLLYQAHSVREKTFPGKSPQAAIAEDMPTL